MPGAGAPRHEPDDDRREVVEESNWTLTVAMAAVVVAALVVGVVALVDTRPGPPSPGGDTASGPVVSTTARPTTTARPSTTARPTTTKRPTTTARPTTTKRPTTTAPTSTAPTTTAPSATTAPPNPPVTTPTTPTGPSLLPDGWYAVIAADGGFRAELPATPTVTAPVVDGPAGPVSRVEYNASGPGGSQVSVTSVPAPLAGRSAEELLDGAAGQVRRDVNGILHLGDRSSVDGAPARRFTVDVRGGRILGFVVHRSDRLHLVSVFDPAGAGPGPTAAFERVTRSFHLLG